MLEPLESGKMYIGDRDLGRLTPEKTKAIIGPLKRTIATVQAIVVSTREPQR
jgi:hypothetical protein